MLHTFHRRFLVVNLTRDYHSCRIGYKLDPTDLTLLIITRRFILFRILSYFYHTVLSFIGNTFGKKYVRSSPTYHWTRSWVCRRVYLQVYQVTRFLDTTHHRPCRSTRMFNTFVVSERRPRTRALPGVQPNY